MVEGWVDKFGLRNFRIVLDYPFGIILGTSGHGDLFRWKKRPLVFAGTRSLWYKFSSTDGIPK